MVLNEALGTALRRKPTSLCRASLWQALEMSTDAGKFSFLSCLSIFKSLDLFVSGVMSMVYLVLLSLPRDLTAYRSALALLQVLVLLGLNLPISSYCFRFCFCF